VAATVSYSIQPHTHYTNESTNANKTVQQNGYIQIAPVVVAHSRAKKGEEKKEKPPPQNAHRLVVLAHKPQADFERMLAGEHASHLCHNTICINPEHIVVESKANEARKACRALGLIVIVEIDGREITALQPSAFSWWRGGRARL